MSATPIAIVGAGPYGLSIAAHLSARGIEHRIFGHPMRSWIAHMPDGMLLKSEPFASNLYDPDGRHTLERFCAERALPYAALNAPVARATFARYGTDFQQRLVPHVEERSAIAIGRAQNGWRLDFADGEQVNARRVVLALGAGCFRNVPAALADLPPEAVSHSFDHRDVVAFKGRDVSVIGGGSSALDLVDALREQGALVRLIARRSSLRWNLPFEPHRRPRWYPIAGMGAGWRNWFFEYAPMLFRCLPREARHYVVGKWLGPAGGWPAKRAVEATPQFLGHTVLNAQAVGDRVRLKTVGGDGATREFITDHVIAATGYKVDLRRLALLDEDVRARLRAAEHTPILSQNFQSSVPGLYFVGLAAANCFGPAMRFLIGARYTAARLARHFANGGGR